MKKYTLAFVLAFFMLPFPVYAQVVNVKVNVINDGAGTLSASDFQYNVGHAGTDGINTGRQWSKAVWATEDFKSTEIERTSPNPVTWPAIFPVTYSIFTTSSGDRIYGTMNTKEQERKIRLYWKENGGSIMFSDECNGMIDIDQTKNCTITVNDGQYKVGQLNIRYTFIGSYSLPVSYTIIQKLSTGGQGTQGGTSHGNPGYTIDVPFDSLNPDAQEYHVIFQPVSPFTLQVSGDCEGQIPLASETRNCLATFRLSPPAVPEPTPVLAPVPTPTPLTPTCSEDIWSCGDYGACSVVGIQSRSCTKTFDCPGVQTATPTTDKSCQPPTQSQPIQATTKIENTEQVTIKEESKNQLPDQIQKRASDTKVASSTQNQKDKTIKPNQKVNQRDNPASAQSENPPRLSLAKRFTNWITHWFK